MASSSKGKNVEGGKQSDWCLLHSTMPKNPTSEMLATLDFPFHVDPEPRDSVPKEFTMGVNYLKSIDGNVPWDRYYARYKKELIPVTNAVDVAKHSYYNSTRLGENSVIKPS